MPRTDDLISDIDDFQEAEPPTEPTETLPVPVSQKSKKKKSKKHVVQKTILDDEEEAPYAKSVTPSPPSSHGVKLEASSAPRTPEPQPEPEPEPELEPVRFLDEPLEEVVPGWEEDPMVVEEPEPTFTTNESLDEFGACTRRATA